MFRQLEVSGFVPWDKQTIALNLQTGAFPVTFTFDHFAVGLLSPGAAISVV
jgi:hypothetical protein